MVASVFKHVTKSNEKAKTEIYQEGADRNRSEQQLFSFLCSYCMYVL